jgi:26S proteasome regulatory subunit N1
VFRLRPTLLGDYVDKSIPLKTSAIMDLDLAYTGSHREDLLSLLLPHVVDENVSRIYGQNSG